MVQLLAAQLLGLATIPLFNRFLVFGGGSLLSSLGFPFQLVE
jgi:hypothetical protein